MNEIAGSARAEEKKEQTQGRNRQRQRQKRKQTEPSLNMSELREIAELIDQHGFTDFEFENENIRVRLSKNPAPQIVQAFQPMTSAPTTSSAPVQTSVADKSSVTAPVEAETESDA